MMGSAVEFEVRQKVGWIALNRPQKLNAINDDMIAGLAQALATLDRDAKVGAIVLFGRGRAFCSGGDLAAFAKGDDASFAATVRGLMKLAGDFRACTKPIIGAVHGFALAGGFELAVNCDIRIAARDAVFGLPDAPIGLSPTSGMTYRLPRIVGLGRAIHLSLVAENFSAVEAERIGLVTGVVAPEDLLSEAERLATRIASFPAVGVTSTKRIYDEALNNDFDLVRQLELEAEIECFSSTEVREQLGRFTHRPRANGGRNDS